ncbi:ABC transporter substrate-binding protein [Halovenus sp. WSH3]|uniref:ABC transporter substrate-binding protein n=1 Tax=Halovenus carboxidivorans TaxID=2692199 RepID=A0A6B0TGU8_9EURY|nr:ABC transporter substrate-binding protein [Halovenus carboxidivorans]MXR52419.1 ABC transporter substrate-binding protein [Halovenus carboxidivorans]
MPANDSPAEGGVEITQSRAVDRRTFLAAAGTGATVGLAGCLGGGGGEGVRIGGVYLLSGLAEALGAGSAAAAEVAVDAINEEGGINGNDVEIEIRDHGDNPQRQMRSLVQEFGADVMIGLTSSGVTLNSGPTIEQLRVPFTLTDIGTPYITEPDTETYGDYYEDNGTAAGLPNLFRTNSNTSHMTYAIARFIQENYADTGTLSIANMGPSYAYGEQTWEYVQAYMDGLGVDYEVVASEFPELGATDMTPQINSVISADPDLLFTSFWAGDTVTFVSQAAEQGLFDQVDDVFDTIGADPTNFEALGDTMPEGLHFSGWYWPGAYGTEADQNFIDLYQSTYEDDSEVLAYPTFTGGSTWAAVQIYKDAIEAAGGTNPDDVISEMEGYTYEDDPRGSVTLDAETHQATASCVIGESSFDADVPYDGAGQVNTQTYTLDRETSLELLDGSGLPPGL